MSRPKELLSLERGRFYPQLIPQVTVLGRKTDLKQEEKEQAVATNPDFVRIIQDNWARRVWDTEEIKEKRDQFEQLIIQVMTGKGTTEDKIRVFSFAHTIAIADRRYGLAAPQAASFKVISDFLAEPDAVAKRLGEKREDKFTENVLRLDAAEFALKNPSRIKGDSEVRVLKPEEQGYLDFLLDKVFRKNITSIEEESVNKLCASLNFITRFRFEDVDTYVTSMFDRLRSMEEKGHTPLKKPEIIDYLIVTEQYFTHTDYSEIDRRALLDSEFARLALEFITTFYTVRPSLLHIKYTIFESTAIFGQQAISPELFYTFMDGMASGDISNQQIRGLITLIQESVKSYDKAFENTTPEERTAGIEPGYDASGFLDFGQAVLRLNDKKKKLQLLEHQMQVLAEKTAFNWFSLKPNDLFLAQEVDAALLLAKEGIFPIKNLALFVKEHGQEGLQKLKELQGAMQTIFDKTNANIWFSLKEEDVPLLWEVDAALLLAKEGIFPIKNLALFVKEHGQEGLQKLKELQGLTEQGRFDIRNPFQRDLEITKFFKLLGSIPSDFLQQFGKIKMKEEDEIRDLDLQGQMEAEATAFEAAHVYHFVRDLVEQGRKVTVVGNHRYGDFFVVSPLKHLLADLGVQTSFKRVGTHTNDIPFRTPFFESFDDVIVVDGTKNSWEKDMVRYPRALNTYKDEWGKKTGRVVEWWSPMLNEKPAISDRRLILVNSVIIPGKYPGEYPSHLEMHTPGFFDDPYSNVKNEIVFTKFGITTMVTGFTEEELVKRAEIHIIKHLPHLIREADSRFK